jgi:hypothetical protein
MCLDHVGNLCSSDMDIQNHWTGRKKLEELLDEVVKAHSFCLSTTHTEKRFEESVEYWK